MQRMKNLLLVLGGTLDALFLKECYEKMQPHFVENQYEWIRER